MKKVLLLGGSGQLGKAVVEIAPLDINLVRSTSKELDLTNPAQIQQFLNSLNPDVIINCAAYTAVDTAEEHLEQAFAVNAHGIGNLAKCTPEATRLIHISTDFVFSKNSPRPYTPSDETAPTSVYGKSKLEGEKQMLENHPENSVIIRTSWLYSAVNKNFVLTMLALMNSKSHMNVVNDQFGSPTSVRSLARIIWKFALSENIAGTFHWCDHGITTWYDFAVEIYQQGRKLGLLNNEVTMYPVPTEAFPTKAQRPKYSALDCSDTEKVLGLEATPWQEELTRVLTRIKEARA